MSFVRKQDFWAGLTFVTLGLGFSAGALGYSFGSSARPGPGYFPFGLGLLLAVLGVAVFVQGARQRAGGTDVGRIAWRQLIVVVGSIALFGHDIARASPRAPGASSPETPSAARRP